MSRNLFIVGVAAMGSLVIGGIALDRHAYLTTQETVYATYLNRERICETSTDEDGSTSTTCTNYVHTDRETFVSDGSMWEKRDPLAMNGRLVTGQPYTFRVYGTASPSFGVYRKVIQVDAIIAQGGTAGGGGAQNW